MSEVVGEGVIRIRTDESGVDIDGAGRKAGEGYSRSFAGSLKGIAVAIGGILAARKVLDFTKESVAEAREAQKVGAATQQIITATGFAAGVSAEHVGKLATSISNATGMDDELIQSGQNLILTFKNVRNEGDGVNAIFDRTSKAAVDLSAAGFGSVTSQSKTLAKALNDPIKGLSALGRSGVTFTQVQQDQIKAMVDQGNLLGAQKVILGEVEAQVGGVAAKTATYGEKASTAYANVKEAIGTALIPAIDSVEKIFVNRLAPALIDSSSQVSVLGDKVQAVVGIVKPLLPPLIDLLVGVGRQVSAVFKEVAPVVSDLITGTLLPAIQQIAVQLIPVAQTASHTFQDVILPAVLALGGYVVTKLLPIFSQLVSIVVTQLVPIIVTLAKFLYGSVYPAIVAIAIVVATKLKPVFDQLVETFATRVLPTVQKFLQQVRTELIPALKPLVLQILHVVGVLLGFAAAVLGKVLPPLIRLVGFILSKVVPALVHIITAVVKVVSGILSFVGAVARGIGAAANFASHLQALVNGGIQAVINAITQLPGKVLALGGRLFDAGRSIIGRLVDGLKGAGGIVSDIAGNVWDAVRGLLNSAIDKLNSALSFNISLPGPDLGVNVSIPHLARGTRNFAGGLALVGEQGPELVTLPRGSQVTPAQQTADALNGRSPVINVVANYPAPEKPSDLIKRVQANTFLLGIA